MANRKNIRGILTLFGMAVIAFTFMNIIPAPIQGQSLANSLACTESVCDDQGVNLPVRDDRLHECRFWGIIAGDAPGSVIEDHLVNLPNSIKNLGAANPDGWSVGYYPDGSLIPTVRRGYPPASTDPDFDDAASEAAAATPRIAVSHVRNTSSGITPLTGDPHPFERIKNGKHWLMGHNGTIDKNVLLELIRPEYFAANPPLYGINLSEWIDSDLYQIFVLQTLEDFSWQVKPALGYVIQQLRGKIGPSTLPSTEQLNFFLTDGTNLWGYREGNTLWYLDETSNPTPYSAVASQPPSSSPESWISMSDGQLITMYRDAAPEVENISDYFPSVPDVVGDDEATAVAAIEALGFVANVTYAYDPVVLVDIVISQDPVGGASVPAGSTVDVEISLGPVPVVISEIIVDNDGPGTSYSGAEWGYSSGANPYGGSSRAEMQDGATYTFEAAVTGEHQVSLWWTYWSSRCSSVPVDIYNGNTLLATVPVKQNQLDLAGKWNVLGSYTFSGTARVVIRAQSGCSSCADAVKFVSAEPVELSYIVITGAASVNENSSADYTCTAHYTDGSSHEVQPDWIENSGYATISPTGLLTTTEVTSSEACRISATYEENGITRSDDLDITIENYVPPELDYIEIEGPSSVNENSSTDYRCIAHYTDGSSHEVEPDPWEENSDHAIISPTGLLTTSEVTSSEPCRISATYATLSDDLDITIENYVPPVELIIDNGDSGTSSTGTWLQSGGAPPIGDDNLYSKTPGSTYTYQASINGYYEVYLHWTDWYSRCTSVPIRIYDGTQLVGSQTVNQLQNGSQWNKIGLSGYSFSGTARVVIEATSTSCSTCADAVKFVSVAAPELSYIVITGAASVNENSSTDYTCTAHYTDGSSHEVQPDWIENSDYATISSTGLLTTSGVSSNQPCRISATYTENSITKLDNLDITIQDYVPPVELIIDNDDPGTSYSGGEWGYSSGANPYDGSSRAEMQTGATYTFQGAVTGDQVVSLWWTYWSSRCSAVPVDIYDGSTLLATVPVNHHQLDLAGKWNVLGSYTFSGTARVVIRAQSGCSSCADAVKFEYAGPTMVTVPNCVDMLEADARDDIVTAGLAAGITTTDYHAVIAAGNVISTTPAGGTQVPLGTTVDLLVSLRTSAGDGTGRGGR